jgi:hypothetical protein
MSLLSFHRFLISAGIVFCLGFAIWEFWIWTDSRQTGALLLALLFLLLGGVLAFYLRKLLHFLGYEREGRTPGA